MARYFSTELMQAYNALNGALSTVAYACEQPPEEQAAYVYKWRESILSDTSKASVAVGKLLDLVNHLGD